MIPFFLITRNKLSEEAKSQVTQSSQPLNLRITEPPVIQTAYIC